MRHLGKNSQSAKFLLHYALQCSIPYEYAFFELIMVINCFRWLKKSITRSSKDRAGLQSEANDPRQEEVNERTRRVELQVELSR